VDAFNTMASELATRRRKVDRGNHRRIWSASTSRSKAAAGTSKRLFCERITTGRVSVGHPPARFTTINSAAARLLSLHARSSGPGRRRFDRIDLSHSCADCGRRPREERTRRRTRSRWPAKAGTPSGGRGDGRRSDSGAPEGAVLVLDDVTPADSGGGSRRGVAAWREVARRWRTEIKNPLTADPGLSPNGSAGTSDRVSAGEGAGGESRRPIIGEVESR